MVRIKQNAPNGIANRRATRFTRVNDRQAVLTQTLLQQPNLRRLAAAFRSFKSDKSAHGLVNVFVGQYSGEPESRGQKSEVRDLLSVLWLLTSALWPAVLSIFGKCAPADTARGHNCG